MTRRLTLCVDDFGASAGIAAAVDELAAAGRLNAVSCLVGGARWADGVPRLARLAAAGVDVGLHFNLSEGAPLSPALGRLWTRFPTLPRLVALAHLRRLPLDPVRAELDAQLARFRAATGRAPDFVDGHQHVHHLPGVRGAVIEAVTRFAPVPWVRNTGRVVGPGFAVKRRLIEATGGATLQRTLVRRGIAHNAALTGVYDFENPDYQRLMQRWLAHLPAEGALLFCHPGAARGADAADPIGPARVRELAYLRSPAFGSDLAAAGVVLGRFSGTTTPG